MGGGWEAEGWKVLMPPIPCLSFSSSPQPVKILKSPPQGEAGEGGTGVGGDLFTSALWSRAQSGQELGGLWPPSQPHRAPRWKGSRWRPQEELVRVAVVSADCQSELV